jgi:hypothetical protein
MNATYARFVHELVAAGCALTRTPGGYEACRCSMTDHVVYIGSDITDEAEVAIIGLHELGHVQPICLTFTTSGLLNDRLEFLNYANELAAWVWAESRIDAADRALFESMRAWCLNSYREDLYGDLT